MKLWLLAVLALGVLLAGCVNISSSEVLVSDYVPAKPLRCEVPVNITAVKTVMDANNPSYDYCIEGDGVNIAACCANITYKQSPQMCRNWDDWLDYNLLDVIPK